VLRALFILAGAAALDAFSWFTYVLGAVLAVTAVKIARRAAARSTPSARSRCGCCGGWCRSAAATTATGCSPGRAAAADRRDRGRAVGDAA
jgi:predicted tellurium resistance membrane protein TerC